MVTKQLFCTVVNFGSRVSRGAFPSRRTSKRPALLAFATVAAFAMIFMSSYAHARQCNVYWTTWTGAAQFSTQQSACAAYNFTGVTPEGTSAVTDANVYSPGALRQDGFQADGADYWCVDTETVSSNPQNCQWAAEGQIWFPSCGTHVWAHGEAVHEYFEVCSQFSASIIESCVST